MGKFLFCCCFFFLTSYIDDWRVYSPYRQLKFYVWWLMKGYSFSLNTGNLINLVMSYWTWKWTLREVRSRECVLWNGTLDVYIFLSCLGRGIFLKKKKSSPYLDFFFKNIPIELLNHRAMVSFSWVQIYGQVHPHICNVTNVTWTLSWAFR